MLSENILFVSLFVYLGQYSDNTPGDMAKGKHQAPPWCTLCYTCASSGLQLQKKKATAITLNTGTCFQ